MSLMRRVRGVVGMALGWGTTWAGFGFALVNLAFLFTPRAVLPPEQSLSSVLLAATLLWGLVGAVSGAAFAVALVFGERRGQSVETLSMERVTAWGALGGALLPLALLPILAVVSPAAFRPLLSLAPIGSVLGVASAAATLRLARRTGGSLPSAPSTPGFLPPLTVKR